MPIKQKAKALMPLLLAHTLLADMPFADASRSEFHLPEVPPDERIQYHGQKLGSTIQNAAGINCTINGDSFFCFHENKFTHRRRFAAFFMGGSK
jgi:hypothetical protein